MRELWQPANAVEQTINASIADFENVISKPPAAASFRTTFQNEESSMISTIHG
ncbi:MAG: hypothetical protein QM744_03910 [Mesorhizobium sp.]